MSLIVRTEDVVVGNEPGTSGGRGSQSTPRRWTSFSAERDAAQGAGESDGHDGPLEGERFSERFRLEAVYVVRGPRLPAAAGLPGFGPGAEIGSTLIRREASATRRPAAMPGPFLGFFDHRHSTSEDDASALLRSWQGNPFRVALLVACAHGARFAALKPEERAFDHLGLPEGTQAARIPVLKRIIRQLHRAGAVQQGEWDTFAYFEMLPEHVAHVREHLAECRDASPSARLVEREVEYWLVKQIDPRELQPRVVGS